jgi:hypothetical protein
MSGKPLRFLARAAQIAGLWFCVVTTAIADPSPIPQPSASSPLGTPSSSPTSAGLNIAFDQIDRTIPGVGETPPMNNFDADVAAIRKYRSATLMPSQQEMDQQMAIAAAEQALSFLNANPITSMIFGAAEQAQQMAYMRKMQERIKTLEGPDPGLYTRYFFYNGWTRIEFPTIVVIIRPDLHEQIILNPLKKTYLLKDTSTPAPSPVPDASQTVEPNPAKVDIAVAGSQTDGVTIAGQSTLGYKSDVTTTISGGIDPCIDGTYRATQLEYYASMPEPLAGTESDAQTFYMLSLPQDCYAASLSPSFSGPATPYQRMYVYRLTTVVRDAALAAAKPDPRQAQEAGMMRAVFGSSAGHGPNYMLLSERGNIRQLTPADEDLFSAPADYTRTN